MTTTAWTSRRLTRYLAVPALALGLALGSAAVADALPEWDIGAYDQCVAQMPADVAAGPFYWDYVQGCCLRSGGVWSQNVDEGFEKCVAPPAESQGRNPLLNEAPTHVIQPEPLPGQGPVIAPPSGGVAS